MSESDLYPLISISTKSSEHPIGSSERNIPFMVSHFGFLMFNLINVFAVLLFYWFLGERLQKNDLMVPAFFACLFQVFSCLSSIELYNINDEYGTMAILSYANAHVAYLFFGYVNVVLILTALGKSCKRNRIITFCVYIAVIINSWIKSREHWTANRFPYFRRVVAATSVFQVVASIMLMRAISKGAATHPRFSSKTLKRVFMILIGLNVSALGFAATKSIILTYPATGLSNTVMVIIVSVAGEMNFNGETASTETTRKEKDQREMFQKLT